TGTHRPTWPAPRPETAIVGAGSHPPAGVANWNVQGHLTFLRDATEHDPRLQARPAITTARRRPPTRDAPRSAIRSEPRAALRHAGVANGVRAGRGQRFRRENTTKRGVIDSLAASSG